MFSMERSSRFITPLLKQCFVSAAVGINIIGHGATLGYPGVLLPQLSLPGAAITLDSVQGSWIASIIGITQLVGSFLTPPIMGRFGRKTAHFTVTMPGLLGWIIITTASSYMSLLIGRTLLGLAIGMMSSLRSCVIGEYSSPKYRGALLTTVSLTQTFGLFLVHLLGSFISWQITALIILFCPVASLVMTVFTPESPSWLADKGRYDECRRVFRWLRGDDEEDELEKLIQACMLVEKRVAKRRQNSKFRVTTSTVVKNEFWKPIVLMCHSYVTTCFSGASVMGAYSIVVITAIMGAETNAHFWMIFLDSQRLISNTIAVFIINRYKQKVMMFSALSLSIFSQLAISTYVYFKTQGILTYTAIWIPAILINIQSFVIGAGILPLSNVIGGEVFPLEYKSIGATISLSFLSIVYFLVVKTFPGMLDSMGLHGTYLVHTSLMCVCFLVNWLLLPETKGKTLQQIEDEFKGRRSKSYDVEAMQTLQSDKVVMKRNLQRSPSSPVLL